MLKKLDYKEMLFWTLFALIYPNLMLRKGKEKF